ncbi:MAG: hypothetical protein ABIZ95_01060 [Pyrinomonadaceae bacterium]
MFKKLNAVALGLVLVAGVFGFNYGTPAPARPVAGSAESLLHLLPASDFVAYGDAGQALNVVLPAILAQHPEWQAKVDRDFANFQRDTGIDPHNFESVAVGVRFNEGATKGSPNFVVLARGNFDAASAIDSAFAKAKKVGLGPTKTEIAYEGHTIYVATRSTNANNDDQAKNSVYRDSEMAAFVFDSNTIAFGDLAGMRSVVDATNGKGRVDDELVALATRTPGAVGGFAGSPGLMTRFVFGGSGGDNELTNALGGIKQIYGSVSSAGTDFDSRVTVRTDNADQSRKLGQMINALKLFTKVSNNGGRRTIESLIRDLNVSVEGNEIDLTLHATSEDLAQAFRF